MSEASSQVDGVGNPFVGPRSFQTDETLFGRDRETRELFGLLAAERIVLLHSPSGAGKTSLVQAALIPKLRAEGFLVRPVIRVGAEQTEAEQGPGSPNRYLLSVLRSLEMGTLPDGAAADAGTSEVSLPGLLKQRLSAGSDDEVLIFDQFEEILTTDLDDLDAKREFFQQIGSILRSPHLYALFSIREEYVAALDPYLTRIPGGLDTRYRLDLLGPEAARVAILRPAQGTDLPITEAAARVLIDDLRMTRVRRRGAIVDDLGLHIEPVQLQVVCFRLWEENRGKARIDEAEVRGQGGNVDSALAGYYADRIAIIRTATGMSERALRDWCEQRLITLQGTRGQVQAGDPATQGLPDHAIAALIDARLVRAEERRGATWYELTHDRLIDPILKNNQQWRTTVMEPWQRAAVLWQQSNEPGDLLLRGWALSRALRGARKAPPGEITVAEGRFLEACRSARSRRRITGLAILTFATVSGGLGWLAWQGYRSGRAIEARYQVQKEQNEEQSHELALKQALKYCDEGDVSRGLLVLAQALGSEPKPDDDLRRAIKSQIAAWAPSLDVLKNYLVTSSRGPSRRSFMGGPEAPRAETALADLLRDAPLGGDRDGFLKRLGTVYAATIDDRNQTLFVSRREYTATLRDTATGRPTGPAFDPTDLAAAEAFAFSPDGRTFVAVPGKNFENYEKGNATTRLWEVASGRPIGDVLAHPGPLRSIQFGGGGRTLLTLCNDGSSWLWDTTDGHRIKQLSSADSAIRDARFGPDGNTLVTLEKDDTLQFRLAATGEPSGKPFSVPGLGNLSDLAFSDDDAYVATRSDVKSVVARDETSGAPDPGDAEKVERVCVVRDGRTGEPIGGEFQKRGPYRDVSFPHAGRSILVVSAKGEAVLWDLTTDRPIGEPYRLDTPVLLARISPDGKMVLAQDGDKARLWTTTGRQSVPLSAFGDAVFSPDSRRVLLIGGKGEIGREFLVGALWDTATGKQIGDEFNLPLMVPKVVWAKHGDAVLIFGDGGVVLRDGSTGQAIESFAPKKTDRWIVDYETGFTAPNPTRVGEPDLSDFQQNSVLNRSHEFRLFHLATDSPLLLGADDTSRLPGGYCWAWNVEKRMGVNLEWLPEERSLTVGYSPDGKKAFTTSFTEVIQAWDLNTGQPVGKSLPHHFRVWSIDVSPDGRTIVTGGADRLARLWDRTGIASAPDLEHTGAVLAVAFSPDGLRILTGSGDKTARLWDVQGRHQVHHPFEHGSPPHAVWFEGDRAIGTRSSDGTRTWELSRGVEKKPATGLRHIPDWRSTRSRDGRHVLRDFDRDGSEPGVEVLDANDRRIGKPFRHPNASPLGDLAYGTISPDGKNLLTADRGGNTYLWDVEGGKVRFALPKSTGIKDIAFLDDTTAITVHSDGSIVFWDVRTGKQEGQPLEHGGRLSRLAVGPDAKTILTGGEDKVVRLWDRRTRLPVGPPVVLEGSVRNVGVDPGEGHPVVVCYDGNGKNWEWPFPVPWDGDDARIMNRVRVDTGKTIDDKEQISILDAQTWQRLRASLDKPSR